MIDIPIQSQPDDETCGPTSLHGVYSYYGDDIPMESVISTVQRVRNGGTIAALLGKHALERGYDAHIYSYSLDLYDPSWFHANGKPKSFIADKLKQQLIVKNNPQMVETTQATLDFIELGGTVHCKDLTINLLRYYFNQKIPVITGLSATYLYKSKRERYDQKGQAIYDDVNGHPTGHFVVLCGYDEKRRRIVVADPHRENPISHDNYYKVNIHRLINAIMLGVLTYDANLLIIKPKET